MNKEVREQIGDAIGAGLVAGGTAFLVWKKPVVFVVTSLTVALLVWGNQFSKYWQAAEARKHAARQKLSPRPSTTAASCPCGCGRTVGRMQRALIPRYLLICKSQPTFAFAASRAIDSVDDAVAKQTISRALENGERVRKDVLLHLHGLAAPGVALDMYHLKIALDAYFEWGFAMMRHSGIEIPPDWS